MGTSGRAQTNEANQQACHVHVYDPSRSRKGKKIPHKVRATPAELSQNRRPFQVFHAASAGSLRLSQAHPRHIWQRLCSEASTSLLHQASCDWDRAAASAAMKRIYNHWGPSGRNLLACNSAGFRRNEWPKHSAAKVIADKLHCSERWKDLLDHWVYIP